jgi:hypothetical protein
MNPNKNPSWPLKIFGVFVFQCVLALFFLNLWLIVFVVFLTFVEFNAVGMYLLQIETTRRDA